MKTEKVFMCHRISGMRNAPGNKSGMPLLSTTTRSSQFKPTHAHQLQRTELPMHLFLRQEQDTRSLRHRSLSHTIFSFDSKEIHLLEIQSVGFLHLKDLVAKTINVNAGTDTLISSSNHTEY